MTVTWLLKTALAISSLSIIVTSQFAQPPIDIDGITIDNDDEMTNVTSNSSIVFIPTVLSSIEQNYTFLNFTVTTSNVTSLPSNSLYYSWWRWHVYVFGLSFSFLGAVSFYTLTHNLVCLSGSQRGHMTISNVLLGIACILRSVYLLNSRDTTQRFKSSITYNALIYESPMSLLVIAMMFYVGGLGSYTQTQWPKNRKLTTKFAVNLLVTPYLITCASIIAIVVLLQDRMDSSTRWSLAVLLKCSSLFWSIIFTFMTFLFFKDIRKASLRKQSQILRATLTKLHIDGTQLPKKLPKPCLGLAANSIAITSILSLITCVVILVGVLFKCDKMSFADSKSNLKVTWIYHHVIRFCEVSMCCSLTCGLLWSQCGHRCRRRALGDITITTFLSSLRKRSVWYVNPNNSLGRRRRHSSDGSEQNHNYRHGMFGSDQIAGSSHAVSRTNFTFERWERTRMPPMKQVPVVDAHFPTVQPILRTFQLNNNNSQIDHSNRISPQHRLQSHLRSSTIALQRTGRNVSTSVVAGLRSLARSRRSSSSSISSGSSLRPSPSRLPLPPPIDGKCSKRFCCCEHACASKYGKSHVVQPIVNTYKQSIRKKHRHLNEISKRRSRDVDVNKVHMVSRATQVYIPSPHKCLEDDDLEEAKVFSHWSSRSGVRGDQGSSTSCSSESAANSFDVRFYTHGSPRDTSTNDGSSSPNHYFHERIYGQRLNVPSKTFHKLGRRRDSFEEMSDRMSSSSLDMVTVCRNLMPKFQRTSSTLIPTIHPPAPIVNHQEEIKRETSRGHLSSDGSILPLSLPLDKDRCCSTVIVKNQQDITPDSAVYLELNSPEDVTKPSLPQVWQPMKPINCGLPRSISLGDLNDTETSNIMAGSRLVSATQLLATASSKINSISRTLLFHDVNQQNKDEFQITGNRMVQTSLDSLYDSGDDRELANPF